ncbi:DUF2501 domain-containing protein [Pantoea ananatis]|uniref:DUF2501 domain-containing protein n=1 Tax=Pantoea ananas TaxID=553 RepID=UPI003F664949
MKKRHIACALAALLLAGNASAASWQDQLSSAANQLSQQNNGAAGQQNGGLSMSSITSLLNSNDKAMSANQLSQQNNGAAGQQNGGLSMSSITSLLNSNDKAMSANSMTNAAGVMQYCVEHNVVKNNVQSVKDQVLSKLGLNTTAAQEQKPDYTQGVAGLLNTGNGQQLNLQSLSNSPMGEKLKTKACDVVLKQGKNFIS